MNISFLGATKTVTGSNFLLEGAGKKILIDCGLYQGKAAEERENYADFPYNVNDIDFLLLTHAHIDHSGKIPKLYVDGYRNPVIAHKATCDLCSIMLPDSGHIQEMENHFTREEILGALQNKQAKVARFSSTMTEKTLYYAKLLSNQDILRISCNQHSVAVLVLGMSQSLLIMFVIAIIICAVIAKFVSKKIVEPLNKINLENPEDTNVYQELKPFTHRISEENFEKEQREELRQQFSANVSHELKTPLTSISGFAEILKNGGTDEQTTKDFANTIYEETQRMISLVNDIIKLSKLDEKSISQEKEEINLAELSREIITALLPVAEKKNVHIDFEAENPSFINGVRSVIYEMVYNLVENAIKYNKNDGKVIVKISKTSENFSSKLKQTVVLSVSDTGIGIPKNEQERIFERFYRIDKSRSKESGGTGLGLSIVKHGAKYHNAKVTLSSQEGKGSTFEIHFEG